MSFNPTPVLDRTVSHAPVGRRPAHPGFDPRTGLTYRRFDRTGTLAPLLRSLEITGGFTVNAVTGHAYEGTGYVVAVGPDRCPPLDLSYAEFFGRYADDDSRTMAVGYWITRTVPYAIREGFRSELVYLGGWLDPDTERVVIEPVEVVYNQTYALQLARNQGQKAIFHPLSGQTIYV